MKFNLKVNENYLALNVITRMQRNKELSEIIEKLINFYPSLFLKYQNFHESLTYKINPLEPLSSELINALSLFKKTDFFQNILKETISYSKQIETYWKEKQKEIENYLLNIVKCPINFEFNVFITHPNTYIGHCVGNNTFCWGHYRGLEDKNYNLVYIIHESLHSIIPYLESDSDKDMIVTHVLIELIADYELYSRLSNESKTNEGHTFLDDYRQKIYPYWLTYIGLNNEEITERIKKDNYNEYSISQYDIPKNLDIFEFNNYLKNLNFEHTKSI